MEKVNIKFGKSALILSLALLIMAIFQLSRMGLLRNTRETVNEPVEKVTLQQLNEYELMTDKTRIAIVRDGDDVNKEYIENQILSYLTHLGYEFRVLDRKTIDQLPDFDMAIVLLNDMDEGYFMTSVMNYVQDGNTAFFPYLPYDFDVFSANLSPLGIIEHVYDEYRLTRILDLQGVLGAKRRVYNLPRGVMGRAKVRLTSDAELLLITEETPLLWKKSYGDGAFIVSSLDFLATSESRGVLAHCLYEGLFKSRKEPMIQPYYGISTTVISDLPVPMYVKDSPMLDEMAVDQDTFNLEHLYAAFMNLSKKYGDKLSLSYTVDYSDTFNEEMPETLKRSQFMLYTSLATRTGGEIVLGGYSNHPLGLKGELEEIGYFVPWISEDKIKESFHIASMYTKDYYPDYILRTYQPPQGRLSMNVLHELKDYAENVDVLLNRYRTEYQDQIQGDYKVLHESGIYLYSIGIEEGAAMWGAVNGAMSLGITSYGFQSYRLLSEKMTYADFLKDVEEAYSWQKAANLDYMTPSQAADTLRTIQKTRIYHQSFYNELKYEIDGFYEGMAFLLRSELEPVVKDGSYRRLGAFYLVYPASDRGTITWKEEP